MSQQNVDLTRSMIEDFIAGKSEFDAEGNLTKIAGEDTYDPDIRWDASEAAVLDIGGVYRGKGDVRRFWQQWLPAWETVEFDYELVDAGDRVVSCSISGCAAEAPASK